MKRILKYRKTLIGVGILLIAAIAVCVILTRPRAAAPAGVELVFNGDCEQEGEGWLTDAWTKTAGYTDFAWTEPGEGADGGRALLIRNHYENDARFWQDIAVDPDSLYRIGGRIKARCSGGWGANLSVEGVTAASSPLYDTSDEWREAVLYVRTGPEQTKLRLYVRLGGYSGEAVGEALFDELSVMKLNVLPGGAAAQNAFTASPAAQKQSDEKGTAAGILILSCLGYALLCALLAAWVRRPARVFRPDEPAPGRSLAALSGMILAGLAIRIVVAVKVTGYDVDVNDFRIWADTAAGSGLSRFYQSSGYCDYPPGYILVLWLLGLIGRAGGGTSVLLVKLPAVFADIGTGILLCRLASRMMRDKRKALFVTALYLFNPLTVLIGSAWGQCDSVMAFFLLLTVVFALKGKWRYALPSYVAAVLLKPQALLFGPLGLLALILAGVSAARESRASLQAFRKDAAIGTGLMLALCFLVVLPFSIGQGGFGWLFRLYGNTMGYYSYATVNSCNLYFLFGLNWAGNDTPLGIWSLLAAALLIALPVAVLYPRARNRLDKVTLAGVCLSAVLALGLMYATGLATCGYTGALVIAMAVIVPGIFLSLSGKLTHLPLCGAACLAMIFAGGGMMHERYLFPAAALLAAAYVYEKDRRILWILVVMTAASVFNCGAVLDRNIRIGGSAGHLSAPIYNIVSDMGFLEYTAAALNVLCAMALTALAGERCLYPQGVMELTEAAPSPESGGVRQERWRERVMGGHAGKGFFNARDALIIGIISALFAVLTFTNLGSAKAPQTYFAFTDPGRTAVLDLGEEKDFKLLYYQGIHYAKSGFSVQTAGEDLVFSDAYGASVKEGDCFKWMYVDGRYDGILRNGFSGRYIRVTAEAPGVTLFEILARDAEGKPLPMTLLNGPEGAENLCDEPFTLEGEPGWYNSAYFDEIYHARTAYEIMRGDMPIYEYTHPPLGKLMMALCVSVFGMTPFGWRFAGALMGVAMLPALYLIAALLFKKRVFAAGAAGLMFFDFMHFTQTRIATIDSFVVCFILWSVFFMLWWFRMDYWRASVLKSLSLLGLSGLFIGLAIASKWTGCYCGAGLAVIFFWGVFRRLREASGARTALKKRAEEQADEEKTKNSAAVQPAEEKADAPLPEDIVGAHGAVRVLLEVLSCFLFFIAVPLIIYYLCYLPVFRYEGDFTVARVVEECRRMYSYHSQPGLGMDHIFYSPWYEWPVIAKPMWFASGQYLESGMGLSITSFGNPAVWYPGAVSMIAMAGYTVYAFINRKKEDLTVPLLILIAFLAQFLPWTLVPRGTYIYHYFASVPFTILATVYLWERLEIKKPRWGVRGLVIQGVLAVLLFVAFFPYISGVAAPVEWMKAMQWFPNWLYFSGGSY